MPPGDEGNGTQITRFGAASDGYLSHRAAEQIGGFARAPADCVMTLPGADRLRLVPTRFSNPKQGARAGRGFVLRFL
jgi:hypothetical protein